MNAGPGNCLSDVAGLTVGHHTIVGDGALTGTTAVFAGAAGMVAGVDVRGGGPGTRETDLLDPTATMETITALIFTGGSAFGLAAASGAADELADRGFGFRVGPEPDAIVPIVPAAVLFDLGRGGKFRTAPGPAAGRAAISAAIENPNDDLGCIGAGTGSMVAGLKGGIGSASVVLADGTTVAALIAVNAMGSPVDLNTGLPLAARLLLEADGTVPKLAPGTAAAIAEAAAPRQVTRLSAEAQAVQNTTIGVIATDATLTKAQCTKLASIGHDGLARAISPVHTLFDGDTLFGVSTTARPVPDLPALNDILCAAGDVVSRAVVRGLLAATEQPTAVPAMPVYSTLAASGRITK